MVRAVMLMMWPLAAAASSALSASVPFYAYPPPRKCRWVSGLSAGRATRSRQSTWVCRDDRRLHTPKKRFTGRGGGGGDIAPAEDGGGHGEHPLQPLQVHLASQACVLYSQNDLHTVGGDGDGAGPAEPQE